MWKLYVSEVFFAFLCVVLVVYGPDWRQFRYDIWVKSMATSLTGVGVIWAGLSLIAALLSCSGFYLPYWIQVNLIYHCLCSAWAPLCIFKIGFSVNRNLLTYVSITDPWLFLVAYYYYILYIIWYVFYNKKPLKMITYLRSKRRPINFTNYRCHRKLVLQVMVFWAAKQVFVYKIIRIYFHKLFRSF